MTKTMKSDFAVGKRVRVAEPSDNQCNKGGAKTHYGRIEDVVRDMYDGSDLYLVKVLGDVKTYKKDSLIPLRKDTKRIP
jgi:hypothetical protein